MKMSFYKFYLCSAVPPKAYSTDRINVFSVMVVTWLHQRRMYRQSPMPESYWTGCLCAERMNRCRGAKRQMLCWCLLHTSLCSIVRFRVISLQSSPIIFVANGSRVRVTIRLIFGVNCLLVMQCATSHEVMRSEVRTSVAATPRPLYPQSPQLCSWRVESATLRLHCYRRDQSKSYSSTLFSSSLHTFALHWGTLSIVVQYGVFSSADGDNSSAWISCSTCVVHGRPICLQFIHFNDEKTQLHLH